MKKLIKILTVFFITLVFVGTTAVPTKAKYDEDNELGNVEVNAITFEEMVEEIALLNNTTEDLVTEKFIENEVANTDSFQYRLHGGNKTLAEKALKASVYVTNKWQLNVDIYKPSLVIYLMADDSSQTAQKIMNVSLDRKSSLFGETKQFAGTLYYNLESPKNAYVEVNGDFFNNGTTTFTGGISVGIGGVATINASVSNATNHYTYYRKSRSYPVIVYSCSMDPDYLC